MFVVLKTANSAAHHGQSRHDCLLEYGNENKNENLQSRTPPYRVEQNSRPRLLHEARFWFQSTHYSPRTTCIIGHHHQVTDNTCMSDYNE